MNVERLIGSNALSAHEERELVSSILNCWARIGAKRCAAALASELTRKAQDLVLEAILGSLPPPVQQAQDLLDQHETRTAAEQ